MTRHKTLFLLLASLAIGLQATCRQAVAQPSRRNAAPANALAETASSDRLVFEGTADAASLRASEKNMKAKAMRAIRETFALFGTQVTSLEGSVGLDASSLRLTVESGRASIDPVTLRFHGRFEMDTDVGPQETKFDQTGSLRFESSNFTANQVLTGVLRLKQDDKQFRGKWTASPQGDDRYQVTIAFPAAASRVTLKDMETALFLATAAWDLRLVEGEASESPPPDRPEDSATPITPPSDATPTLPGDQLRDRVGEFVGQFRSEHPDLPEQAASVGVLVGVTNLCDGATVAEALAAAVAAAEQSREPVQWDAQHDLVTAHSPPVTPGAQILSGANAQRWLVQNGYLNPDGTPLPAFQTFRGNLLSSSLNPGDALLGIGGDWNLHDPSAPLGYVTIVVREPGRHDAVSAPPSPPDDGPPPAGGVKLSDNEINDIVKWGVAHNRSLEDIRKDLRDANESAGGSGDVPLNVAVAATPLGNVTANADEVAEYQRICQRIEQLQQEKAGIRGQINDLEKSQRVWLELNKQLEARWLAGMGDLSAEYGRLQERLGAIERKYARPSVWDYADTVAWREALAAWERLPEARGQESPEQQQEIADAHHDFVTTIQNKTTDKPKDAASTSWFNRHIVKLEEISRQRGQLLADYGRKHAELQSLLEQRTRFEQRALR